MADEQSTQGGVMVDADYDKARDVRARRAAERQGLRLERARVRDPRALDYGSYRLVDMHTNVVEAYSGPGNYGLSLEEVERLLDERPRKRRSTPKGS